MWLALALSSPPPPTTMGYAPPTQAVRQATLAAETSAAAMHAELIDYSNRLKKGTFLTAENLLPVAKPVVIKDMAKALRVSGCWLLVNGGREWASRQRLGLSSA
jgi:hypothetical protein